MICVACRTYDKGNKCASCEWKDFGYDVEDIKEQTSAVYNAKSIYAAAAAAAKNASEGKSFFE